MTTKQKKKLFKRLIRETITEKIRYETLPDLTGQQQGYTIATQASIRRIADYLCKILWQ